MFSSLRPSFRLPPAASGQSSSAVHALKPLLPVLNCSASTNHHKHSCSASTSLQAVRASAANQQRLITHSEPLQSEAGSSWAPIGRPSNSGSKRQRQPIWLQPLKFDEVWYLGYGSNMNPQVLTGRRRVRPQQSMPCYVPGYTLSFGVQGFPWAEPGFATIQPCRADSSSCSAETLDSLSSWRRHVYAGNTPCLHAVLHRVTKQDWAAIKASEGVLGSDNSGFGYQVGNIVFQLRPLSGLRLCAYSPCNGLGHCFSVVAGGQPASGRPWVPTVAVILQAAPLVCAAGCRGGLCAVR
jgi:hypothetical protein